MLVIGGTWHRTRVEMLLEMENAFACVSFTCSDIQRLVQRWKVIFSLVRVLGNYLFVWAFHCAGECGLLGRSRRSSRSLQGRLPGSQWRILFYQLPIVARNHNEFKQIWSEVGCLSCLPFPVSCPLSPLCWHLTMAIWPKGWRSWSIWKLPFG